jgi:integrase
VSRHALPRWGKLQASTISRSDVKALMARIEAPVLANQVLAAVSAIFTWAVREEILPANPCKLVARNPTRSRERVLSDSEVPMFWSAFDDAGLVASTALKMIVVTGQRPGEIAHMRREHIKDGWWEMPGDPVPSLGWPGTKNAQAHRVWLSAPSQALIAGRRKGCPRRLRVRWRARPVLSMASTPLCAQSVASWASNERPRTICDERSPRQ